MPTSNRLSLLISLVMLALVPFVRSVIESAPAAGAKVGLCGQAPSDHPEFAAFLVECGTDSISVTPDSFIVVKQKIAAAEQGQ